MAQPQRLETLANELVELSKTHQPSAAGFGSKSPLVVKAEELIQASQTPVDHAMSLITATTEASAIRTLASFKVFDALPSQSSAGATVAELEKTTGIQAALLNRLLRILAGSTFLNYDTVQQTYGHTELSAGYTSPSMAGGLFPIVFDEISLMTKLHAYFKARGAWEPDGEEATTHNPTTWNAGQEGKTVFEILEQDPEKLAGFVKLMASVESLRP